MAKYDYSGIAATASRLITRFGIDVTVISKDITAHDPVKGEVTSTPDDVVMNGIVVTITAENLPDGQIQQGDKLLFVDGAVVLNDQLEVQGQKWQAVRVDLIQPANTPIVTRVQIRK